MVSHIAWASALLVTDNLGDARASAVGRVTKIGSHAFLYISQLLLFFAISDKKGGFITHWLQHPLLLWFASISLEIYLTHMLVFRVVNSVLTSLGFSNEVLHAAVELIAMFPFAWLTKRFFVDKIGTLGLGTWDIKPKF